MSHTRLAICWAVVVTAAASAADLSPGKPADVDIDPAKLADAASLIRRSVEQDEIRGAVILVARRGKIVLHEAYGHRDSKNTLPMEKDTLFRMASNSKAVTAAGILLLVDDGKLPLDDPVAKHLPAFDTPESKSITVRQLLTHTGGLRIGSLFLKPLLKSSSDDADLIAEVNRFAEVGPKEKPGESYSYNNAGYNILAGMIQKLTGSYKEHLRTRIYQPIGMADSCNHESDADPKRMSEVYRRKTDGTWQVRWKPADGPEWPFPRGSGGMVSTARDYAAFCQMLLNGGTYDGKRILSEAMVREAINPQSGHIPAAANYGLGWMVGEPGGTFSHTGSDGTYVWVDPQREIIGMVLTQTQPENNTSPHQAFRKLVNRACTDIESREPQLSRSEGFYKDLFMSGGVNLSSRKQLYAAESLGLAYEYYAGKDKARQNALLVGNPDDENGVLLYPDGSPRFRMIYVNGGGATAHGKSLTKDGRNRLRTFNANGGGYCGSCAGSFFSGRNVDDTTALRLGYLHIFPFNTLNTGMKKARVDHVIPEESALLRYRSFGPDRRVTDVYHNNGNWLSTTEGDHLADTEILATYANPGHKTDGGAAVWAYRKGEQTGRVVNIGSHPEGVNTGDRLALTEACFLYTLDGASDPRIKATLTDGVPWDEDCIGDRQYHHFRFEVGEETPSVSVRITGPEGIDLNVYIRKDATAFASNATHRDTSPGSTKTLTAELSPGMWHVSVECETTVTAVNDSDSGFYRYVGDPRVLNGVPYSITKTQRPSRGE